MIGSAEAMVSGVGKIGKDETCGFATCHNGRTANSHAACDGPVQRCIPTRQKTCRAEHDPEKVVFVFNPEDRVGICAGA
jgi:hypothetical protein